MALYRTLPFILTVVLSLAAGWGTLSAQGSWIDRQLVYSGGDVNVYISFRYSNNSCVAGGKTNKYRYEVEGAPARNYELLQFSFKYLNCQGIEVVQQCRFNLGDIQRATNIEMIDNKYTGGYAYDVTKHSAAPPTPPKPKPGSTASFCDDLNLILHLAERYGVKYADEVHVIDYQGRDTLFIALRQLEGLEARIYKNRHNKGKHFASFHIISSAGTNDVDEYFKNFRQLVMNCLGNSYYEKVSDDQKGRVRWFYAKGENIVYTAHPYLCLSETNWGPNNNELYLYIYDPAK